MKWLALALLLSGCAGAGGSSRCAYDWVGALICEQRFHHAGKPGTYAMYAYEKNGTIVPLYAGESSSVFAPIVGLISAGAP